MSKDKLSIARCPHMFGKYFDLHQFLHLHIFLPKFGSSQTSALPHTILPHGMSVTGGIYGMFQRELTNSFTLVFPWMLGRFRLQVVKLNIIYPANQTGNRRNQGKMKYSTTAVQICTVNLCLLEETQNTMFFRRFWAWIHPQQSKRIDVRKMLKHDLVLVEEISVPRVLRVCGWYDWGSRLTKCDALKSYYFGTRFGTIIKVLQ